MRSLLLCSILSFLLPPSACAAEPQATRQQTGSVPADSPATEQFRPLFNGQDLTGWVLVNTPPQTWTVQDGLLVCSGRPTGEIRTERMYQNFILELEWRHLVPRGNAGVFVWADDITARGVPFHRSIEVQVLENAYGQSAGHTTHGDIFPIHGATLTPLNGRGGSRAFPTEERSRPSPEWNHYRIECRDGAVSLAVNGKVVTRGQDASPRRGYICLESEGGVVHYRNVRIQELPDTPVEPQHVATASRGYRSLYTGLNLDGWQATPAVAAHWQVQDWILAYDGGLPPEQARLATSEQFADFGFVVDVRGAQGFTELQLLRGSDLLVQLPAGPAGQWQRIEGTVSGGRVHVTVDGRTVVQDAAVPPSTGALAFQPTGPAAFANFYVRSLQP